MATVLVTGTGGYIGKAFAEYIAARHTVVGFSRHNVGIAGATEVRGDITKPEDFAALDDSRFDAVVHLAAVKGGGKEAEAMRVNLMGSYNLMRYLADHGCRKFVMASSIAAVGFPNPQFRPLSVPIADEHPCLDSDGYGFAKWVMEETTRYFWRQKPELDFINLRLAAILVGADKPKPVASGNYQNWSLASVAVMFLEDTLRCLTLALEAPHKPGVRVMNATAAQSPIVDPVPVLLRSWYGAYADTLDLSWYKRPGHERDGIYDLRRIEQELGFVPRQPVL